MLVILDYNVGNCGSILNMVRKVGGRAIISADHGDIAAADRLILPGVGAFDHGMDELERRGLIAPLTQKVLGGGTPILGICLGMQLFGRASEEGHKPGLGWIDAHTVRFRSPKVAQTPLRIPHMGWNHIAPQRSHPLLDGLSRQSRFYFVHSYHMLCDRPDNVLCTTNYGDDFTSAVVHGNIVGVQFHPEKSHRYGLQLIRNFVFGRMNRDTAGDALPLAA
jgi:glutamine amidotransferase